MLKKLLFLFVLMLSYTLFSQTIYVDQNATGLDNGTDWANAYTNLQTAITNIGSNTTINVAQGTYYPTATTDRTISFNIPRDKKLFGGFPTGGGTRDPELYPTTLSGDIGTIGDNTDNSYHVVYFYDTSPLNEFDGFIVEKGYANGSGGNENVGGGIFINTTDTRDYGVYIRNCTVRNNYASYGGGISAAKQFKIYNCKIYSNHADANGGGLTISTSGNIYNSYIVNNSAGGYGGGIYLGGSIGSPKAINCVIANNECLLGAGAYQSKGSLINCTIVNNKGNYGVDSSCYNSIIWGNDVNQISNITGSENNLVQDFTTTGTNMGISNTNNGAVFGENYPRFTKSTSFTGNATNQTELDEILNADWSINPQSAAIDFGDNSSYPTTTDTPIVDIIGNNRTINTTMDAGAYEALTNIITNQATNQQPTSADLNGDILFAETTNTITRGFVYATTPNFDVTTSTSVTNSATGLGVYSDNITGLTENQFYYYRTWIQFDSTKYYANEVQFNTSNLIAYYPFNGNANDESGNNLNGTVNGATLTTDRFGNPDSAYSFDGSDIITIAHNDILNCSNELSFSVWVKLNIQQDAMILGKSNYTTSTNYLLRTKSTGFIQFEYKDFANSNSLPLTASVWNHIAVISKSDNSKQVYINGVLATHTSDTSPFGLVTNALTIGARPGAEFFNGNIDDLRIYSMALTEAQVLSLYSNNTLALHKVELNTNSSFYVHNHILYFKNTQNLEEIKNVEAFNLLGQKVFETSKIEKEIPITNLPKGIYILKVENKNSNFNTLKFINY
jgi:hypothetical protein